MKKLMMILFAVAMTTATAIAQETKQPPAKKTPEERAEMATARMTKTLALNEEQQQKVKALILKREKDRENMQEKARDTRQKVEAEMEADLQKILNAEQFEKFKKKKEEMKSRRKDAPARKEAMPPPHPEEK
ncbi:MAG TPA: hypothetical protein VF868_10955 [Bacteroidia bacterium]|jgi:methionine-rich copper-binding protein CopC